MYERSGFLTVNIVNTIPEVDYKSFPVSSKSFSEYRFYQVQKDDIFRPLNISVKIYGISDYWWILMKINGIVDIYNEINEDTIIKYPPKEQIDRFLKNARTSKPV